MHEVQHRVKSATDEQDKVAVELHKMETRLRDLRTQLIGVNHRIADREMKTTKSRKRLDAVQKRSKNVQLEAEDDHAALLDQIQDLHDVQRAMIQEVDELHGEKAGATMRRLAERNEKAKKNLLKLIFARRPRKISSISTVALDSDDETSDAGSSVRTSLRFERGFLSRLSSRDRSRERRPAKQKMAADSSVEIENSAAAKQMRRPAERARGIRPGKMVREETKLLYVRNLERARVEESRSIHFLEACVQQRVK